MGDTTEIVMWNGRQFELTVRREAERWVAWVKVVGKDDLGGRNSASFTGMSDGDVCQKAQAWMVGWRN